jgi:AcrR family transcriptional regulator
MIDAGLRLLERGGPAAVSLRAVAREVGVSQAAPYGHFDDKRALMSSIAAAGFEKLGKALGADRPSGMDLRELGLSYVDFALAHPGLYNLMFGAKEHVDPQHADLVSASRHAFAPLAARTAPDHPDPASQPAAIAAWSLVHGIAMLMINDRLGAEQRGMLPEVLGLLSPGLAHKGAA